MLLFEKLQSLVFLIVGTAASIGLVFYVVGHNFSDAPLDKNVISASQYGFLIAMSFYAVTGNYFSFRGCTTRNSIVFVVYILPVIGWLIHATIQSIF